MHTPPLRNVVGQRIAAVTVAVVGAGLLFAVTGSAAGAPAPTVAQVQKKITQLRAKSDQLGQQYDQVQQQLASTNQRLTLVKQQLSIYSGHFSKLQAEVAKIAINQYETGGPSLAKYSNMYLTTVKLRNGMEVPAM